MKIYSGWIVGKKKDTGLLQSLGVKIGKYNRNIGMFENCIVDEETLSKLDYFWGKFYWGFKEIDSKETEMIN